RRSHAEPLPRPGGEAAWRRLSAGDRPAWPQRAGGDVAGVARRVRAHPTHAAVERPSASEARRLKQRGSSQMARDHVEFVRLLRPALAALANYTTEWAGGQPAPNPRGLTFYDAVALSSRCAGPLGSW